MAKIGWMLGGLMLAAQGAVAEAPKLADVFGDHMVIQRDAPVILFGSAEAGSDFRVMLDDAEQPVTAGPDGHWSATFPALGAGGPHTISLREDGVAAQTVSDVLAGDVFLCSGQSNMEFPVSRATYADGELAKAANDRIRLLKVSKQSALTPQDALPEGDAWAVSTAETAAGFSAVCFFTGQAIEAAYDVPVGLIDSSWGGSRIEPWISEGRLRAGGGHDAMLDALKLYRDDKAAGLAAYAKQWTDWWKANGAEDDREPWTGDPSFDWQPTPNWHVSDWQTWGIPELEGFLGLVWHRTTFTLTPEQAMGGAEVHIGGADDVDVTWLNGVAIGATHGWGTNRVYSVPPGALKAGENTLVVNVDNSYGAGGMSGPDEEMKVVLADGSEVSIAGGWTWMKVPPEAGRPAPAPWYPIQGFATLHNAMIAPLGGIRLKGALWYQGESNAGEGKAYEKLLRLLIADWREQFGADLPAMVVQLPRYGALPQTAGADGWGAIRESMRQVAATDPRTGLVVTIDTGDPADIHPPNKRAVASRMVRLARSLVYGEQVTGPSGPEVASVTRDGDTVKVAFSGVEDGLDTVSSDVAIGFEACVDGTGCRYVSGTVSGDAVMVYLPDGAPADEIRYCQGGSPLCNVFDGNGLPAGPFRMAVESVR
ncbi:MAG: hypothetical protein KDA39_04820 [Hyphomonas sp.]|nr:hypothetical protein [Hyphomonas sp.]